MVLSTVSSKLTEIITPILNSRRTPMGSRNLRRKVTKDKTSKLDAYKTVNDQNPAPLQSPGNLNQHFIGEGTKSLNEPKQKDDFSLKNSATKTLCPVKKRDDTPKC